MIITGTLFKVRDFTSQKTGVPGRQINVEMLDIRLAPNLLSKMLPPHGQEISVVVEVGQWDGKPTFTATDIVA